MNDEEYFFMKSNEKKETEKAVYKLRLKDFIPLIGVKKYDDRCNIFLMNPTNEGLSKMMPRGTLLDLYNTVLIWGAIMGTAAGTSGLVSLLTK